MVTYGDKYLSKLIALSGQLMKVARICIENAFAK